MEGITLIQALEILDSGAECSLEVITADRKKKNGGEWLVLSRCRKHEAMTREERRKLEKSQPKADMLVKNPNHYQNSTRNVLMLDSDRLVKVHIRLIRRINGLTVT